MDAHLHSRCRYCFYLNSFPSSFQVSLLHGIDFYDAAGELLNGAQVKLHFGGQMYHSSLKDGTANPEWSEEFVFPVENEVEQTLDIAVMDRQAIMGMCRVKIESLPRDVKHPMDIKLFTLIDGKWVTLDPPQRLQLVFVAKGSPQLCPTLNLP